MEAKDGLEEYLHKKLQKIEHLDPRVVEARVYLELYASRSFNSSYYKCAIRLAVAGPDLYAEKTDTNLFAAIDTAIKRIEEQLKRRRKKVKETRHTISAKAKQKAQLEQLQ